MQLNFSKPITKLDHTLIPDGFRGSVSDIRLLQAHLSHEIDEMGALSAKAQGLKKIITTAEKLRQSDHILYLAINTSETKSEIVGFLKVGKKKLYLYDLNNKTVQVEPICILDFYVIEHKQRLGFGKRLFDYMLKDLDEAPDRLAIDGPSDKLKSFMKKHYNIDNLFCQSNNFAVTPQFFDYYPQNVRYVHARRSPLPETASQVATPGASGRFTATQRGCSMGLIIHGHQTPNERPDDNRSITSASPSIEILEVQKIEVKDAYESPERRSNLDIDNQYDGAGAHAYMEDKREPLVFTTKYRPNATAKNDLVVESRSSASTTPAGQSIPNEDNNRNDQDGFKHMDLKFYHSKLW